MHRKLHKVNGSKKTGLFQVKPGDKVHLDRISTRDTGDYAKKDEVGERLDALREQLSGLQERLYAEGKHSLLIVLQAMDTGGKDGAIKNLLTGINPAGVTVTSFKAPSANELNHDFLWRIHAATPPRGYIGVWNRSHYEDVLITRVHGLIDKKTCKKRYEDINAFESVLHDNGTTILKFFLHISKEEQKERLQARLDNPEKRWKFNPGDLKEREFWDKYQDAYENALSATSTEIARWHIVPSDHKWGRNIALAEAVVAALDAMNPKFPKADFDHTSIVIE